MTLPALSWKKSERPTAVLIAAAGSLMIAGGIWWYVTVVSQSDRMRPIPFSAAEWRNAQAGAANVRIRMINDLLSRYPFIGRTRQQVIGLLGEPQKTGYFKDWDLVYLLGPERSWMGIDSEWLVLRLNKDGTVTDAKVMSD
jgi:hypothetical protein